MNDEIRRQVLATRAAEQAEREVLAEEHREHSARWKVACSLMFPTPRSRVDHECYICDRPLIRGGWAVAEPIPGEGYLYHCWPCAVKAYGPDGEPRPDRWTGHWHGAGCIVAVAPPGGRV